MKPRERDPVEEQRIRSIKLPGVRITYWREVRGYDIRPMAKDIGVAESSLRELESGDTKYGKKLHEIAEYLELHYEYLRNGKGPAELATPAEPPAPPAQPDPWPLPGVSRARIEALGSPALLVQREWLEGKINALLDQIDAGIKETRRAGSAKRRGDEEIAIPAERMVANAPHPIRVPAGKK